MMLKAILVLISCAVASAVQLEPPSTYRFYDPNYPIIFNIILWMMIGLGVTILFISLGIWNMDPGRDSIIYRMTASRVKKD